MATKCLLVLFFVAVGCVQVFAAAAECELGEIEDSCPSACSDRCPSSEDVPLRCTTPSPCPESRCRCRFNYRRADNGTCIPTAECQPFPCFRRANEEYIPCPPLCPSDDCSMAQFGGRCPLFGRIGIVLECSPACRCMPGFYRDQAKECVPAEQCVVVVAAAAPGAFN